MAKKRRECGPGLGVQPGSWLIEQDDFGAMDDRLRDRKSLTKTARKRAGLHAEILGESDVFRDVVAVLDTAYARQVYDFDKELLNRPIGSRESSQSFFAEHGERLIAGYDSLAQFLRRHEAGLAEAFAEAPETPRLARQAAWSLGQYVRQNTALNPQDRTETRDRGMADNLTFLLNEHYPDKKIIVWGHNFHIRHANHAVEPGPVRTVMLKVVLRQLRRVHATARSPNGLPAAPPEVAMRKSFR